MVHGVCNQVAVGSKHTIRPVVREHNDEIESHAMFIVHADLTARVGCDDALTGVYRDVFCPAVAMQRGFFETTLLLSRSPAAHTHRLVIVFETEHLQQKWAASDLHNEVWVKMAPALMDWSVRTFDSAGSHVSAALGEVDNVRRMS